MPTIKENIQRFRELKDQKAQLKAKYEEEVAPIDEEMSRIQGELLLTMNDTGVDSFKTDIGTAYKTSHISVTCQDKSAFMDYVRATDNWGLLEVRPSKSAVEEMVSGQNLIPPGVNRVVFTTVNIRKN